MLNIMSATIRWLAALAGLGTVAIALLFSLAQQASRPAGHLSGRIARLATSQAYTLAVALIYVVVFILLWRPLAIPLSPGESLALELVGALIFFPSLALYLFGMRTLGRMFGISSGFGVRLYASHRLVTSGPYAVVRHPMYLAVIAAGIGGLLIYQTWAMVFFAVSMFGLAFRAKREEKALAREFGPTWEEYQRRVPAWIPKPLSKNARSPKT